MDSTPELPPPFQYGDNDDALQALLEDWPSSSAEPLSIPWPSFIDFSCYEQYRDAPSEFFKSNLAASVPNTRALVPSLQAASTDPTHSADANRGGPIHSNATLYLDASGLCDSPTPVHRGKPNPSHHCIPAVSTSKLQLQCHWTGCTYNGTFARKADLMRHIENTHVDPRAHKCPSCGKLFNRKDNLDHHLVRVHGQN